MFSQVSIKARLIIAFSLFGFLLIVIGSMGLYTAYQNVRLSNQGFKDKAAEGDAVRIKYRMEEQRAQLLLALQHNPELPVSKLHDHPVSRHLERIETAQKRMRELLANYQAGITDPEEKRLADVWQSGTHDFSSEDINQVVTAIQANQWNAAEEGLVKSVNPNYNASQEDSKALADYLKQRTNEIVGTIATSVSNMTYIMLAIIIFAVISAIIIGWMIIRSITVPLHHAVVMARRVADGDLRADVGVTRHDEVGALLTALNDMNNNLAHIVGEVRVGTGSIASASAQITAGNMDLSNRTEAQASSLEETASAMEQLTSTVKQNADNARQANQLAETASQVASKGGAVVSDVVNTMSEINDSARKIADIIGVIDGIAFQTNILALNAAVEAARAGEQGRGFAVVATEVRSLAQRSAAAAKEIKLLIDDSVDKVEQGNKQAAQAGTTMREVVSSVQRVTDIMSEISAASREQSQGIEEINNAITQMDETTQQNAALVEQAAAAAKSLQDQAGHLEDLVNQFQLDDMQRPAPRATVKTVHNTHAPNRPAKVAHKPAATPANKKIVAKATNNEEWEEF
ncbi:MAG: methyl-accepting chemotaxis protein [Sulfuriferula sp.]